LLPFAALVLSLLHLQAKFATTFSFLQTVNKYFQPGQASPAAGCLTNKKEKFASPTRIGPQSVLFKFLYEQIQSTLIVI